MAEVPFFMEKMMIKMYNRFMKIKDCSRRSLKN